MSEIKICENTTVKYKYITLVQEYSSTFPDSVLQDTEKKLWAEP